MHTHSCTHTHTCTHTRAHARAHTHTHAHALTRTISATSDLKLLHLCALLIATSESFKPNLVVGEGDGEEEEEEEEEEVGGGGGRRISVKPTVALIRRLRRISRGRPTVYNRGEK